MTRNCIGLSAFLEVKVKVDYFRLRRLRMQGAVCKLYRSVKIVLFCEIEALTVVTVYIAVIRNVTPCNVIAIACSLGKQKTFCT